MFEEFSRALTELLRLIPWEDAEHGELIYTPDTLRESYAPLKATDGVHHVYLAREPDGSISGLTEVMKYRHEPGFVRQGFTGVQPAAQGRGLGKWLKGAMLEHVRAVHPDTVYVTTENAGSNAPAQRAADCPCGQQQHFGPAVRLRATAGRRSAPPSLSVTEPAA